MGRNSTTTISQVDALDLRERLDKLIALLEEDGEAWVSRKKAAEMLDMHPNAFGKLAKEEGFSVYRVGEQRVRYSRAELTTWVRARRVARG